MSEWVKNEGKMPVLGTVPVEVTFANGDGSRGTAVGFTWIIEQDIPHPRTIIEWRHADPTDSEIIDWLADTANSVAFVMLPNECVVANVSDMREAIKMAMRVGE